MTRKGSARIHKQARGLALLLGVAAACMFSVRAQDATPQPPAQEPATEPPAPADTPPPPKPEPPPQAEEWTPISPGTETEVTLKGDGRTITGLLIEHTREAVVLSIQGIRTTFKSEDISRVAPVPDVTEWYHNVRPMIDDEDVDKLLILARRLRDRGRLDFALWEVDHILKIEPANPGAKELRTQLLAQQALQEAGKKQTPSPDALPQNLPRQDFPRLNKQQINLIRIFETDLKDPPRMIIRRDTVTRFLDKYAGRQVDGLGVVPVGNVQRELFLRSKPADVLAWLFAVRAREFYPEVEVQENPSSMRVFIRDVHSAWLVNTCATAGCHGGDEAGRLWLDNRAPRSDEAAYTNFLIIERFRTANGKALIDYSRPEDSVLLNFGLPLEDALFKHPEVVAKGKPKWRPAFGRGRQDPKYLQTIDWIKSMYTPREEYPIQYEPPKSRAAREAPTGK